VRQQRRQRLLLPSSEMEAEYADLDGWFVFVKFGTNCRRFQGVELLLSDLGRRIYLPVYFTARSGV